MSGKKMETQMERVCIHSMDAEGCGTCANCRYGKVADQLAAMAYDLWRATRVDQDEAVMERIRTHWRKLMLIYRELTPNQERYIAKE